MTSRASPRRRARRAPGPTISWSAGPSRPPPTPPAPPGRFSRRWPRDPGHPVRVMPAATDGLGEVLVDQAAIEQDVARLGAQISGDYAERCLHIVSVLKGSAVFVADLMRALSVPATLDFISIVPYAQASNSGVVRIKKDL